MGAEFYHHNGVCSGGGSRKLQCNFVKATCKKSGKSFCFMKETSPEMLKNKIAELAKING